MIIKKEIRDNEFYLSFNGKTIFKKWLDLGYSKVFSGGVWPDFNEGSITDFDLSDTPPVFQVKCKLSLLETNEGGRLDCVRSGYRPKHVFEYESDGKRAYSYIGDFQFDKDIEILPGESKVVIARFLSYQPVEQYLKENQKWWIYEDGKIVGESVVIGNFIPPMV